MYLKHALAGLAKSPGGGALSVSFIGTSTGGSGLGYTLPNKTFTGSGTVYCVLIHHKTTNTNDHDSGLEVQLNSVPMTPVTNSLVGFPNSPSRVECAGVFYTNNPGSGSYGGSVAWTEGTYAVGWMVAWYEVTGTVATRAATAQHVSSATNSGTTFDANVSSGDVILFGGVGQNNTTSPYITLTGVTEDVAATDTKTGEYAAIGSHAATSTQSPRAISYELNGGASAAGSTGTRVVLSP